MTTNIKERLRTLSFAMGKIGADSLERLYEEAASRIEQLEGQLSAQTAVKTEQPSLSDERDERKLFEWWAINNQPWLLERSTDDAHKLLILTAWEAWQAAISAQRQDSDKLAVVHKFLLGEGPLDGLHFGDVDTKHPRAPFWWRKFLRAAIANGAPK